MNGLNGLARKACAWALSGILAVGMMPLPAFAATDSAPAGTQALQPANVLQTDGAASAQESEQELSTGFAQLELYQEGAFPEAVSWPQGVSALSTDTQLQDSSFSETLEAAFDSLSKTIDVSRFEMTTAEVGQAYQDFVNANPRYFFVSGAFSYSYYTTSGNVQVVVSITPSYNFDLSEIPAMRSDYEDAMNEVLSWVPKDATDTVKAKAVHDWLVRNCAYNTEAASKGSDVYGYSPWCAYGALVAKSPVCQGYSLAYVDALTRLGVACQYVSQRSANHGWTRVCVDGHWYHVDVTWDDPLWAGTGDAGFDAPVQTAFFLKSDSWMVADSANQTNNTHAAWSPEGTPSDDTSFDDKSDWETYSGPAENPWTDSTGSSDQTITDPATDDPTTTDPATDNPATTDPTTNEPTPGGSDPSATKSDATTPKTDPVAAKASSSIKLATQTKTYTGRALAYSGEVTRTGSSGKVAYSYYSDAKCTKPVAAKNVKAARTYYVKATLAADANYEAATSSAAKFVIAKAANTLVVKSTTKSVKRADLKKKARVVAPIKATKNKGKVTYTVAKWVTASAKKRITVNKATGKVTVKKGTPQGTYKLKVKVKAAGTANYNSGTKTVTVTIKVK